MPRKKKASELTTDELEKRVFPKKAVEELKRIAHEREETEDSETENSSQDESNI
ncbi:MAG: hypothetical protein IH963_12660 [Chloroflexi bacterium]|nr:hypothetical protein [Chloroflexota bacterium]